VISAFILHFITGGVLDLLYNGGLFSTYYISLSIFLAYALTYPDMRVMLYFVIPIKMKWMAIVYALIVAYDIVRYVMAGAWFMALPIVASLLNFIIFFLSTRNLSRYNPKEVHRRNQFKRAMGESKTVPFPGNSQGVTNINVQSAAVQRKMIRIWNSVSVLNVTETMSTVRIIYIHIYTRSKRRENYYEKSTICHPGETPGD